MSAEDVTVKIEEEDYVAEAYPVENEEEGPDPDPEPVEENQGLGAAANAVAAPLKDIKNPMDAMDGYTLLVLLLVSSIVVFVAACVECFDPVAINEAIAEAALNGEVLSGPDGISWWAFVGSLLSIIACIILIVFKKCAEDASITAGPWIMMFMLLLWTALVIPCTFIRPFNTFGNGWIGVWLSMFVAGALASRAFADKAKSITSAIASQTGNEATKYACLLGASSIIVMVSASIVFSDGGGCVAESSYTAYCISVAVISIVACILILVFANVASLKHHSGKVNVGMPIFLIIWWILGTFFATFKDPFRDNCNTNGYISTWISLFAAIALFKACGLDTVKQLISKVKGEKKNDESNETPAL